MTRPLQELLAEAIDLDERKRALLKNAGKVMREEREAAGVTQTDAAAGMGVTRAYLSMIENGTRTPTPETVAKFAATLREEKHGKPRGK